MKGPLRGLSVRAAAGVRAAAAAAAVQFDAPSRRVYYPRAEQNLSAVVNELTSLDVRGTSPIAKPGRFARISSRAASPSSGLRRRRAVEHFEAQMRRVLPGRFVRLVA